MKNLVRFNYNKIPGIYCISDNLRNRVYIGSSKNLYSRINGHINNLLNNNHPNLFLQRHFNTYGQDSLEIKILEVFEKGTTSTYLLEKEQHYYDIVSKEKECFNSHSSVTYFSNNITLRDLQNKSVKNSWKNNYDEMRSIVLINLEKARKSFREKIDSGELKLVSPRKGVVISIEVRKKQSLSALKARKIKCNSRVVSVIGIDANGIETRYQSARGAIRELGILNYKLASNITACCTGRRASAFKYKWKYGE